MLFHSVSALHPALYPHRLRTVDPLLFFSVFLSFDFFVFLAASPISITCSLLSRARIFNSNRNFGIVHLVSSYRLFYFRFRSILYPLLSFLHYPFDIGECLLIFFVCLSPPHSLFVFCYSEF